MPEEFGNLFMDPLKKENLDHTSNMSWLWYVYDFKKWMHPHMDHNFSHFHTMDEVKYDFEIYKGEYKNKANTVLTRGKKIVQNTVRDCEVIDDNINYFTYNSRWVPEEGMPLMKSYPADDHLPGFANMWPLKTKKSLLLACQKEKGKILRDGDYEKWQKFISLMPGSIAEVEQFHPGHLKQFSYLKRSNDSSSDVNPGPQDRDMEMRTEHREDFCGPHFTKKQRKKKQTALKAQAAASSEIEKVATDPRLLNIEVGKYVAILKDNSLTHMNKDRPTSDVHNKVRWWVGKVLALCDNFKHDLNNDTLVVQWLACVKKNKKNSYAFSDLNKKNDTTYTRCI